MEQEQKQTQTNREEAALVEKPETGIPALDWGLRIQRKINETTDPKKKQELQEFEKEYWAVIKLIGLYE